MSINQVKDDVNTSESSEHSDNCKCRGCDFWRMASSVEEAEEEYLDKWFKTN